VEGFERLFGGLPTFAYQLFRLPCNPGHLPLLTRPENLAHFFRKVDGVGAICKECCASGPPSTSSG
jgi:hypothetical protein